jgi:hypothetical protein
MTTAALINAPTLPPDAVLGMGHLWNVWDIAGTKGGPQ